MIQMKSQSITSAQLFYTSLIKIDAISWNTLTVDKKTNCFKKRKSGREQGAYTTMTLYQSSAVNDLVEWMIQKWRSDGWLKDSNIVTLIC